MLEGSKIIVMPSSNDPASSGGGVKTGEKDAGTANAKSSNLNEKLINNIPPPKTDKPRPHRCATCLRGFARLEHLKRHERSHTKEKPFECDQCSRCFARRDLLLRHQQKLHELVMPSSRARNRRESTTNPSPANAPGRVRKNSLANSRGAAVTMRPRANTISHVEGTHTQLVESVAPTAAVRPGLLPTHNRHASLAEPAIQRTEFHSCSGLSSNMGQRAINHSLPKIDTNNFHGVEYGMGLRTAPLMGRHGPDFYFERLMFRPNSTINPNALHYNDSLHSMTYETTAQYNTSMATDMNTPRRDENIEWMNSFESGLSFHDQSSPAAINASSPSRISDIMLDGSNHPAQSTLMWPPTMLAPRRRSMNLFSSEHGNNGFHDILNHGQSPSPLHTQPSESDSFFSTPPLCPRPCAQNNFEGLELS